MRKRRSIAKGYHLRDQCRMSEHPDFVRNGISKTDQAFRVWEMDENEVKLYWNKTADGTPYHHKKKEDTKKS